MLQAAGIFLVGFALGLVAALFIDTEVRLNRRSGSPLMVCWIRFRVLVLGLWERKFLYLILLSVCLGAGLLIGSLSFLPGVEGAEQGWMRILRRLVR